MALLKCARAQCRNQLLQYAWLPHWPASDVSLQLSMTRKIPLPSHTDIEPKNAPHQAEESLSPFWVGSSSVAQESSYDISKDLIAREICSVPLLLP